jgi:hypothetical protein
MNVGLANENWFVKILRSIFEKTKTEKYSYKKKRKKKECSSKVAAAIARAAFVVFIWQPDSHHLVGRGIYGHDGTAECDWRQLWDRKNQDVSRLPPSGDDNTAANFYF